MDMPDEEEALLLRLIRERLTVNRERNDALHYSFIRYVQASKVRPIYNETASTPHDREPYQLRILSVTIKEAIELLLRLLDNKGIRWRSFKDDPPEIGRPVLFVNRSIEYARVGYRADDAGLVEYVFNILSDMGRVQAAPVWWCAIPETPKK